MKTLTTFLTLFALLLLIVSFSSGEVKAQVEIPKDEWTAYAFRYQQERPVEAAVDGDLETKFGMGGSASEGRWFMIDLGGSYDVTKVVLTYVPGEEWKNNFILGFDLYVTDYKYPVNAASAPKEQGGDDVDGELFTPYPDSVTASITYPEATETAELEFPAKKGRYVWFVSNGPTGDWWEIHEISVFKAESTSVLKGLKTDGFNIYPNPINANGNLTINIEEARIRELNIYDIAGKTVYTTRNLEQGLNTLELNLNSGLYILNIPGYQSKKLIVK